MKKDNQIQVKTIATLCDIPLAIYSYDHSLLSGVLAFVMGISNSGLFLKALLKR